MRAVESSIEGFTPVRDSDASFTDACLYSLPPSLSDDIPKTRNVPVSQDIFLMQILQTTEKTIDKKGIYGRSSSPTSIDRKAR